MSLPAGDAVGQSWLGELSASIAGDGPALDRLGIAEARRIGAEVTLQAPQHPLLIARIALARAGLAVMAIRAAESGSEAMEAAADAGDHARAAAATGRRLAASGPRVEVLSRAAALLAATLPHVPEDRSVQLQADITAAAGDAAVAVADRLLDLHRGETLLQAATAAEAAERRLDLAEQAWRHLVAAGDLAAAARAELLLESGGH